MLTPGRVCEQACVSVCAHDIHHRAANKALLTLNDIDRLRVAGRGAVRAEDAQGTPTQSHISPSILLYEDMISLLAGGRVGVDLTECVCKVVLQRSTPPQIRQPILYYYQYKEHVDQFVWALNFAQRL